MSEQRIEDYIANLEHCLASQVWLDTRGITPGDLPGETLADTFRRELETAIDNRSNY